MTKAKAKWRQTKTITVKVFKLKSIRMFHIGITMIWISTKSLIYKKISFVSCIYKISNQFRWLNNNSEPGLSIEEHRALTTETIRILQPEPSSTSSRKSLQPLNLLNPNSHLMLWKRVGLNEWTDLETVWRCKETHWKALIMLMAR